MSARIPLHKRLLVRLLITSGLIAVCSVAATAWLAVATTTQALREEQGQALADDMEVLAELSGYAATHPDWTGVAATVRELSAKTGRRIALVTPDRRTVADSAARGTALPPSAAATVDPLRTDTYSERGAQIGGIDPRVVGPYRLTKGERTEIDANARKRQSCFARNGIETTVVHTPSGRAVLTEPDSSVQPSYVPDACADGVLNTPMPTEQKALDALQAGARLPDPQRPESRYTVDCRRRARGRRLRVLVVGAHVRQTGREGGTRGPGLPRRRPPRPARPVCGPGGRTLPGYR